MRTILFGLAVILAASPVLAQPPAAPAQAAPTDPGRRAFETRCARCHGGDANGGEMGPSIVARLGTLTDAQLATIVRQGTVGQGMPAIQMDDAELGVLTGYLRSLQPAAGGRGGRGAPAPPVMLSLTTTNGRTIAGRAMGQGFNDVQLLGTADSKLHLFRRDGDRVREVTSEQPWPTYNGDPRGNRYTTLTQIDKTTVTRLAPAWVYAFAGSTRLQGTPVVVDGVMYVTSVNECIALDAGSGRQIWRFMQPRTQGVVGNNANRGVAVAGDLLFIVTDHAHLIALNRHTGQRVWDTEMDDFRQNYFATGAPLVAGELVISGVGGGEQGANGFVAAYEQTTGKEVWRFWTVPKPGTPGSETWKGKDIDHGGAPTWFTGSYDPELDIVYWPVGNPSKEYNGDDRQGDNLYASTILALDRKTGTRKWHYQFTPHDLWDWDATQTSVLIDSTWEGRPRKLMLHASRNGFFYVFDRVDGTLLLAKPFVRNLTWASGIGADGRPVRNPGQEPSPQGTKVCPSQDGATNWFSPSYNPATGLYYVQTYEKCSIYTKSDQGEWQAGRSYLGGSQRVSPDPKPERVLKAIDIKTGAIKWEIPQPGPATSWGGTLSTSTGLVIFGEESGNLMAADAVTGKVLWSFPTNHSWHASPMTYQFDGKQYIGVLAGGNVMTFAVAGQ